jgi:hypothetical protein
MYKTELLNKYNIFNVYSMPGIVDALFSYTELDPMFWADSDGHSVSEGKPFLTAAAFGPDQVFVYVVIFRNYKGLALFERENGIIELLQNCKENK